MRTRLSMLCVVLVVAACSSDNNPAPPPPVNQAPTIGQIADQMVEANQSTAPITVAIADDLTAISQLQLNVSSDNELLVPSAAILVNANANSRELIITPSAAMVGSAVITLTVTDGAGASASTSFVLAVDRETLSYAEFIRSVFEADQNELPLDINSREFIQDAEDDEFSDIL